jgi:hypothetical protein
VLDEHRRITRYDGAVRNMAEFIDNANGCLLHRNVETNVMGLRHGMAPIEDWARHRAADAISARPELPHLSPTRRRACIEHARRSVDLRAACLPASTSDRRRALLRS